MIGSEEIRTKIRKEKQSAAAGLGLQLARFYS
jgi:hypothetical protein